MKTALLVLSLVASALAQTSAVSSEVDAVFPAARSLYLDLHQNPELSSHEIRTASELAGKLRALGYEVTEHVGGTGIVALLKNGNGPTVMLRTELDALPVEEKTGLVYASHAHAKDDQGHDVPVMHACGHDMHMASLYGAAEIMQKSRQQWHGTLMLIGQPAEETLGGAKAMLADHLFTRFPKPDIGLALHTSNELPAGKIGLSAGYRKSNADALGVTIYGKGGHGSKPESTIDPVLIAAKIVVALQAIVSREIHPGDPAVITVGLMQAGTKNNIIPDQAFLGLTVRSYSPEVRQKLLASIQRVVDAEATAGGAVKMPKIEHLEATDAVYNDPAVSQRLRPVLRLALGEANVVEVPPTMASEDYSLFIEQGVPSVYLSLGGADPQKWAVAKGADMPSNHSSLFQPELEPTLRTGITAEVAALRALLQ
ncbi:MAG: amidohydrolase [Acidobacteriales bacterium]|nr:amidohydrolase [Terriglobales bacterium]